MGIFWSNDADPFGVRKWGPWAVGLIAVAALLFALFGG